MGNLITVLAPSKLGSSAAEWRDLCWRRIAKFACSRACALVAFTILYLVPTVLLSRIKLFWDDEFFTLYLARTPDWRTLLEALSTGADQHPPSFYYLTHWIIALFGTGHVTLRLTAIFGFWLLCVCLYEIVRPLTNPLWAIVAMLFPLTTNLYYYGMEARGYGLVTGFAALAVLSWLRSTAFLHRKIFVPLLAFSVAAAVASHYYAALITLCLIFGELVRTISRRRVDWPVWIAFAFTGLPLVIFLRTIESARGYSSHFWAFPSWSDALFFYPSELSLGPVALLGTLGVAAAFGLRMGVSGGSNILHVKSEHSLNAWEATAICSLSALPVLVMFVAKFVTHGFTERYAIGAIVGITILLTYLLYRIAPQARIAGAAAILCVAIFGLQAYAYGAKYYEQRDSMASDMRVLSATGDQQIAVVHITVFHQLSFYAPRQIAKRLTYVSDPESAIKYMGHDTIDRGLMDLNPWFPLRVIPVQTFLAENREFLVYGNVSPWSWLTFDLPKWGETRLVARSGQHLLLAVKEARSFPGGGAGTRPQPEATSRMMYSKLPQTGPALCRLYMGVNSCPYNDATFQAPKCDGDCNTFHLKHPH